MIGGVWLPDGAILVEGQFQDEFPDGSVIYLSSMIEIQPGEDKWSEYAVDAMGLVPYRYRQVVSDLKAEHRRRGYTPAPDRSVDD